MKILVVLGLCLSLWSVCHAEGVQDSLKEVSRSSWDFATSLYKAVTKTARASDSIIISPLSVQMVLAMAYIGAGGETAKHISRAIGLPDRPDLIQSGFQQLFRSLHSSEDVILEMAANIFPSVQYPVLKNFSDAVYEFFLSDIESVDYRNPSEAATIINRWVAKKTHNRITNIVSENRLDFHVKMVLINAVYFKGIWQYNFDRKHTSKAPFYVNGKDETQVDTMHLNVSLSYQENEYIGARFVELFYTDKSTMLVIVLPLALDGLPSVEAKLEISDLMEVLKSSKLKEVALSLPRFSLTRPLTLNDEFKKFNMAGMFTETTANFSKMTSDHGLSVSEVMHKATLDVDEEGTMSAEGTSRWWETDQRMPEVTKRVEFAVDHPFMFALVSKQANAILLTGRYTGGERVRQVAYKPELRMDEMDYMHKEGKGGTKQRGIKRKRGGSSAVTLLVNNGLRLWMLIIVFPLRMLNIFGPGLDYY